MTGKKKKTDGHNSTTAAEASALIEQHIQAFLSTGGKIELIDRGVSGVTWLKGSKHITIGNRDAKKR